MNVKEINAIYWQPKINSIGDVVTDIDDINQCISTILETRKGSVPHNPDFGSDVWMWIDAPIDEARPNITKEAIEAIEEWEQRIDISRVTVDFEETNLILKIEWTFKESNLINLREIRYDRT
jgi:hypothetical protein